MAGAAARKQRGIVGVGEAPALEELNLVEFPLALLADHVPDGMKTLEFADSITDESTGAVVSRQVVITGSDKFGLPNWQDQDVLLALMVLTCRRNSFRHRTVEFTLYELRELLSWPRNGSYNARLQLALDRWCSVYIKFEGAWRRQGRWTTEGFHILDNVKLTRGRDFDADEQQVFKWNDVVVASIQESHTRPFDWEFYSSLGTPTAKRLYRFLAKRFHIRKTWDYEVVQLCTEKLGLIKDQPAWRYKDRLKGAIAELVGRGFLEEAGDPFVRVSKGLHRVAFVAGKVKLPAKSGEGPPAKVSTSVLEAELKSRGVNNPAELVRKHSEAKIRRQIENYDDRIEAGEDITAGWLVASIGDETGYGFRKGYVSKEQREAQARKKAERERAKQQERLAEEKWRAEERQKEEAEKEEFRELMARYTEEQLEALERAGMQAAHREGKSFVADQVTRRRREGESVRELGPIRRHFWREFVLPEIERCEGTTGYR